MKSFLVLFALLVVAYSETYDTRYDDFDAAALAENTRLLKAYAKCFLGQGPCTAEGNDFKKTIPDALRTNCNKCSPKQRVLIRTVVKAFQSKTPDLWEELVKQEDPTGQYKEAFTKFINSSD